MAALIAAGTAWGTSIPFSKAALGWLDPGWLTVVRFGLAGVVLLTACARSGRLRGCCMLPVLASGALGYGGAASLANLGLARTTVTQRIRIGGVVEHDQAPDDRPVPVRPASSSGANCPAI